MNIVLLGFRGTGKSTLARILAQKLKRKRYSLDDLIVQSAGIPISQIVAEGGWTRFRAMESRVVREVTESVQNGVIDCGGGVVLDPKNIERLRRNGKTVLLHADFDTLLKRIRYNSHRPPLTEGISFEEEQRKILAEREAAYRAAADLVCDTTRQDSRDTAKEIIDFFEKNGWI